MASETRIRDGHNEKIYQQMKPGDLIEIPRGNYSHWAVHVGDGLLVHLWGDGDRMGELTNMTNMTNVGLAASGLNLNKAKVCRNNFWEVVGNSQAKINNDKDRKHSPYSVDEIVANALSRIGEEGYNLIWKNCEHFASWCRYGVERSEQVEKTITWATVGTALMPGLGLFPFTAGALVLYHVTKSRRQGRRSERN